MPGKVQIINLYPEGVYKINQAVVFDKWIEEEGSKIVHIINRSAVFTKAPAIPFSSVAELVAAPSLPMYLNPKAARQMLFHFNDPVALVYKSGKPEEEAAALRNEAHAINQATRLDIMFKRARENARDAALTSVYFLVAITAAVVTLTAAAIMAIRTFM